MRKHLTIKIFGKVQGVDFRATAKQQAKSLGIAGTVKNEQGDFVTIEAEGEGLILQRLVDWCKTGSVWSKVVRVEAAEGPMENFTEFKIL